MTEKFEIILYHAIGKGIGCTDGFGSFFAAYQYNPHINGMGCVYQEDPPWQAIHNKRVIVADVSWDRATIEKMHEVCSKLVILDHHATAQDALRGLSYAFFDMDRSGALMTWQFFFPDAVVPPLVAYISDADLWAWKLRNSREISAWLQSHPQKMELWVELNNALLSETGKAIAIEQGKAIMRSKEQMINRIAHKAEIVDTDYGRVAFVNSPVLQSEVGEVLAQQYGMAAIWHLGDGELTFSFRSKNDELDVSKLALMLGGGGHKQAAGVKIKCKERSYTAISETMIRMLLEEAGRKAAGGKR